MYELQFCEKFGLSKLEKCFSTFKSDEISRTFVFDTSKFSSIGKSSMIISRLVLLNSVPDTFKLDKFLNLDKETTIVFFFASTKVEFETFSDWKYNKKAIRDSMGANLPFYRQNRISCQAGGFYGQFARITESR